MQYPNQHRDIVRALLNGKFITDDSPFFDTLQQHDKFYDQFFQATYGYYLEQPGGYYYLTSQETTENSSRDLLLFLAVLCYEYHTRGKDIVHKMQEGTFLVQEVVHYIETSSKQDLLKKTQVMDTRSQGEYKLDIPSFLEQWAKRNLLQYTDKERTQFQFKKPIQLFLDTAFALYQ
ncbi:MAG: hypothetical protein AAGJ35_03215, partial [Myxococcota bacterium]